MTSSWPLQYYLEHGSNTCGWRTCPRANLAKTSPYPTQHPRPSHGPNTHIDFAQRRLPRAKCNSRTDSLISCSIRRHLQPFNVHHQHQHHRSITSTITNAASPTTGTLRQPSQYTTCHVVRHPPFPARRAPTTSSPPPRHGFRTTSALHTFFAPLDLGALPGEAGTRRQGATTMRGATGPEPGSFIRSLPCSFARGKYMDPNCGSSCHCRAAS